MLNVLLVGLGGFLGSVLRYAVGGMVGRVSTFPLATLVINVAGCVVIGLLAGLVETRGVFSQATRAFLFIGILGGFTTFSTFGYETFQLLREGRLPVAMLSLSAQVVLGVLGVWAGHAVATTLTPPA